MKTKNQIITIYLLFGISWILFSDQLTGIIIENLSRQDRVIIHIIKGLFFISANALLLNYLINAYHKKHERNLRDLLKSMESNKEKQVRIRKQNNILKEIAWINSHSIRKPVASILGLSQLIKISKDPLEKQEYQFMVEHCILELDSVVRHMAIKLEKFNKEE